LATRISTPIWNFGGNEDFNLRGFQLYASSDASFSTSTLPVSFQILEEGTRTPVGAYTAAVSREVSEMNRIRDGLA
jgi:hypothetical protein